MQFQVQSVIVVSKCIPSKVAATFSQGKEAASAYDKGKMYVLTLLPAKWWTLVLDSME